MPQCDYELLVIGSGPAGQRAAIQAAKLGKRVALVEKRQVIGGVCINTGTIPSKTLREAVLYLSGYRQRSFYGTSYVVKQHITMEDLLFRTNLVIRHEIDVTRTHLQRNGVEVISGEAAFVDPHRIRVDREHEHDEFTAENVIIACGTTATRDDHIPFDGNTIFTCDDILQLDRLPKTLAVVGAGVIGCEYATIFSTLGVRVTLIDKRDRLLPFVDHEIGDALTYHMRGNRVVLRLAEEVQQIEKTEEDGSCKVRLTLGSGKLLTAEKALYSIGRTGNTAGLNLQAAGLAADDRGRLQVNDHYQTPVLHIYAAGDVIGFPSLASTSMEQGRLSACHAFGAPATSVPELFPYGIYTIPEISMCGRNEEELTRANIPYEIGMAHYREIARGQIIGDTTGMLKLLFHQKTRELLGVHIIGEGASELIHIGQAVMSFGGKIDYFISTVFNYPTLAECYKTAAFNGINRLGG